MRCGCVFVYHHDSHVSKSVSFAVKVFCHKRFLRFPMRDVALATVMKITAGRRPKSDCITRLADHFCSDRSLWPAKIQQEAKNFPFCVRTLVQRTTVSVLYALPLPLLEHCHYGCSSILLCPFCKHSVTQAWRCTQQPFL